MLLTFIEKKRESAFHKVLSSFIAFTFIFTSVFIPSSSAQSVLNLPQPGTMIHTSPAYSPAIIKGIYFYPDNPLKFDFLVDAGQTGLKGEALKDESMKMVKYFLAALTVPEDQMWVNLSPYEKERIAPEGFAATLMGRDMLAQDYMLKQLTASLMYPEDELGSEFWNRVYKKAQEKYGTTEIPMNTFNKVWIVPQSAEVYEHNGHVFVVNSHLKVMLEEDYLALDANSTSTKHGLGNVKKEDLKEVSEVSAQVIRDILIPEIEREVNQGETFANLRQIYNSVILATWYKQNLRESLLGQVFVDQNKVAGINTADRQINEKIYDQYMQAFQRGVFDMIKEDYDPAKGELIPRKYFSGGVAVERVKKILQEAGLTEKQRTALVDSVTELSRLTVEAREVSLKNLAATGVLAQRITAAAKANTGELNVKAARRAGANGGIAGHSEARANLGDTDKDVNAQLKAMHEEGLRDIIFAFGEPESIYEDENSTSEEYISMQIVWGLEGLTKEQVINTIFAYEPIWAIGTGKTATPEYAQGISETIRAVVAAEYDEETGDKIRIIYGGSVTPDTAAGLIAQPDIDGFLVGGASNEVESFKAIIEAAAAQGPTEGRVPYAGSNHKTKEVSGTYYDEIAQYLKTVDPSRVQVGIAPSVGLIGEFASAVYETSLDLLRDVSTNAPKTQFVVLSAIEQTRLEAQAKRLIDGKLYFAGDGSTGTGNKFVKAAGIEVSEDPAEDLPGGANFANREKMRQIFAEAPGVEHAIGGVIVFDEYADYKTSDGLTKLVDYLASKGIAIIHKTDRGMVDDPDSGITPTEGLDREKLPKDTSLGLHNLSEIMDSLPTSIADKYRVTFTIDPENGLPSDGNIERATKLMAAHSLEVQQLGRTPTPEPEVLIKGDHTIEDSANANRRVWKAMSDELIAQGVHLPGTIYKVSMVTRGKDAEGLDTPEEVARATVATLVESVPAEVGGIVFLSGGQTSDQAIENLNAIAKEAKRVNAPWRLTASFSRASKNPALGVWDGKDENIPAAKEQFAITIFKTQAASYGVLEEFENMVFDLGPDVFLSSINAYGTMFQANKDSDNLGVLVSSFGDRFSDFSPTEEEETRLEEQARRLIDGKLYFAGDGSTGTGNKFVAAAGIEISDAEGADAPGGENFLNREKMRQIFAEAPGVEHAIGGVIVFDEYADYKTSDGLTKLVDYLASKGIAIIHKTDRGMVDDPDSGITPTEGLDREKLPKDTSLGLHNLSEIMDSLPTSIADKYRVTFTIDPENGLPSDGNIERATELMAVHSLEVQQLGRTPTPEPEVLIKGDHRIEEAAEANRRVWTALSNALIAEKVHLPGTIYKVSMVTRGKDAEGLDTPEEVARATVATLVESVPAEVGGIVFLSGGQTSDQAIENLNAIAKEAKRVNAPWRLTASFSRASKGPALAVWDGKDENIPAAKEQFAITIFKTQAASYGVLDNFEEMLESVGDDVFLSSINAYGAMFQANKDSDNLGVLVSNFGDGFSDFSPTEATRLEEQARRLIDGKLYFAGDGSTGTGNKFVAAAGIAISDAEGADAPGGENFLNREKMRQIFAEAPGVEHAIGGVIVFDEYADYKTSDGLTKLVDYLASKGIAIIHKTDRGMVDDPDSGVTPTEGLDREKLPKDTSLGLDNLSWIMDALPSSIADKYRVTFTIDPENGLPSDGNIARATTLMAQHSFEVQQLGRTPTPEPEVLIKGDHTIEEAAEANRRVWTALSNALIDESVHLPGTIYKVSMVTRGKDAEGLDTPEEVARATVATLMESVPESVGGIVFLSGGQTSDQAIRNLNAIAKEAKRRGAKWRLTASFSRASKNPALTIWDGKDANIPAAKKQFSHTIFRTQAASYGVLEQFDAMVDRIGRDIFLSRINAYGAMFQANKDRDTLASLVAGFHSSADLSSEQVGGIDFNPSIMSLQIKRDGAGVPLPVFDQPVENMQIDGFLPVIINVTPVTNLPMLLGAQENEPKDTDLSFNLSKAFVEDIK